MLFQNKFRKVKRYRATCAVTIRIPGKRFQQTTLLYPMKNTSRPLNAEPRKGRFIFSDNSICNLPKDTTAWFSGGSRLPWSISIIKFGRFKNSLAKKTVSSELGLKHWRFILSVETREVVCMSNDSGTTTRDWSVEKSK